jgi:hypothetical protein
MQAHSRQRNDVFPGLILRRVMRPRLKWAKGGLSPNQTLALSRGIQRTSAQ